MNMDGTERAVARLAHALHARLLWLLIGSYALAALLPDPGLWFRQLSLANLAVLPDGAGLTLPAALLALLLFNAGLGIDAAQVGRVMRGPRVLLAGLAANLAVPLLFLLGVAPLLGLWHDPDEAQSILAGLALVAAMPVAGSSAAWSQNGRGNLALSLGLVLFSTLLSPLTTPVALRSAGWLTTGPYSAGLRNLAAQGSGSFLAVCVLAPSLLGVAGRALLGRDRVAAAKPWLTLLNCAALLLLNYANAAASLPEVIANPDWDFLALMLAVVLGLCVLAFGAGWWIARALKAGRGQQTALMFGLGMNNNGTGLVLAATSLGHLPSVMLPVLCYNLIQHLVAGAAQALRRRRELAA
jgi:BASS family bile acid:Na+ symporter